MPGIKFGAVSVSECSDEELADYIRRHCGRAGRRIKPDALPVWVAALRAFDSGGTPATVRQTFYALTVLGAIAKTEQGYKQVVYHLLNMRRTNIIPYNFLADNTRWIRKRASYASLDDFLERTPDLYRKAVWDSLDVHVEIWIEKEALAGVVYPVTNRLNIPLMVTPGYCSETFVYEAAQAINREGKKTFIYYFGDYDPFGVGTPQDVLRKLESWTSLVTFTRVAVNPDQITSMRLPTRPTKRTDSRAKTWTGDSVELDAIPPNVLRDLVQREIEAHLPPGHLARIARVERNGRTRLAKLIDDLEIGTGVAFDEEEEDLDFEPGVHLDGEEKNLDDEDIEEVEDEDSEAE
jgi:hypothetical protein